MKITNLECPSCGGKLKPMEGSSRILVCEYCGHQFVMEDERPINYHIHQYSPGAESGNTDRPINFTAVFASLIGVIAFMTVSALIAANFGSSSPHTPSLPTEYGSGSSAAGEITEEPEYSPLYEAFVDAVFGRDAAHVTAEELESVKYISVLAGSESYTIRYSLQSPYGSEDFAVQTLEFEPLTWDSSNLSFFTGLEKLDIRREQISSEILSEFTYLKGLTCRGLDFTEIADMVPAPGQIVELEVENPGSLEGIAAFENLEILSLEDISQPDLRQLVPLKKLRCLSVEEEDSSSILSEQPKVMTDYSAISALTGLERLELESSSIRDFGFLTPLTNLTELSISDTEAISLEPVAELSGLISLRLIDNSSIQDYAPVNRLSALTTLTIDKGTAQPDPDLSALNQLENLDMSGFISIGFLKNMAQLKSLSIHGCNVDEICALSSLSGLENLSCYSVWTYATSLQDVSFIDGMTSLKTLDFCGADPDSLWSGYQDSMEIWGDISNVFNHAGLEELTLNQCTFGIAFDRLTENPSLKRLEMKEINLKENFYVESYGGVSDIWYDDVSLNEHIDFLANYPNLESLYLDGNQLTDIQFTTSLKNLTHLSLNNNYVTDLSPLHQAEYLQYLDIRMNPITNTIEGNEKLRILSSQS